MGNKFRIVEKNITMLMNVVRQIKVTIPDLSQRIKQVREQDGRSVQVLATIAGISTAYWYQIEKDERQWISEETLRGIEKALGIDLGVKFVDKENGLPPSATPGGVSAPLPSPPSSAMPSGTVPPAMSPQSTPPPQPGSRRRKKQS